MTVLFAVFSDGVPVAVVVGVPSCPVAIDPIPLRPQKQHSVLVEIHQGFSDDLRGYFRPLGVGAAFDGVRVGVEASPVIGQQQQPRELILGKVVQPRQCWRVKDRFLQYPVWQNQRPTSEATLTTCRDGAATLRDCDYFGL